MLERIGELFAIEEEIRGRPPQERQAVRAEQSVPLLAQMKARFEQALGTISRKSSLAEALRYSLTRWDALTRYTTDGRLDICNNAAERAIRPLALGRKNWTFAGADSGGERAATIYTIIETAKLNGLDPEAYLRTLIGRIGDHPATRIGELLPWNVKRESRGHSQALTIRTQLGRRIKDDHAVGFAQLGADLACQFPQQGPMVPGRTANELVQGQPLLVVQVGDGLDPLALQVRQQPGHVAPGMRLLLRLPQTGNKRLEEVLQPRLHITKHARVNDGTLQRLLHPCCKTSFHRSLPSGDSFPRRIVTTMPCNEQGQGKQSN